MLMQKNTGIHEQLAALRWHRISLLLRARRALGKGTPPLVILNALLKSIKPEIARSEKVRLAFHVPGEYAHRIRRRAGETIALEIECFGADEAWLAAWSSALARHMVESPHAGFDLAAPPAIESRSISGLEEMNGAKHAELECLAPLPFKRDKAAQRTQLSTQTFFTQLSQRAEKIFGIRLDAPQVENIRIACNYWNYTELPHASKSQPGHTQYFNGCFGPLYFSGDIESIAPWLRLAEAIHAGGSLDLNALGYCRLHLPARPLLDEQLATRRVWETALQRVQESHDDWLPVLASAEGAPFDTEKYCLGLSGSVLQKNWQPAPSQAFAIPKRSGQRRVEKLPPAELLVHTLLHEMLSEPIDRTLETSAIGFRRGRSVQDAVGRVRELLSEGYRYVAESDIENFFPAISIERMLRLLDETLPPADAAIRELLGKLLLSPYIENGEVKQRRAGLAQGSPLSPLLANLYLDCFDEAFNGLDAKLVRYADDFIILARTRENAEQLLCLARKQLGEAGMTLAEEKTDVRSVEEGFHFLGQPFGGEAENAIAGLLAPPVRKTVYITEPGCFLGQNGDALEIRRDGKLLEIIPLRRVSGIAVLVPASFSSGLVQRCARLGVPLTMTLGDGYHIASLPPDSRAYHDISVAQALHYAQLTPAGRLALAKMFAGAKIGNYKALIAARYTAGSARVLKSLDECMEAMEGAADTATIRGHEGRAARLIFAEINRYIKVPEFNFEKRSREKPDRMNVLFNFGYYLLFSRLNTMVRAAGLNPYLGFLHDGADDYETLVCDIQELFRAPVDRHLISLVNMKIIRPGDFSEGKNGLRLAPMAIKRFLEHFERLLHSDAGGVSLLQAMQMQVQAFARYVSEDKALWCFSYRAASSPESRKNGKGRAAISGSQAAHQPVAAGEENPDAPWQENELFDDDSETP